MVEVALAISIIGILTAVSMPRLSEMAGRTRVTNAARVVAADLDLSLALAARQRHAVRLVYESGPMRYTITDQVTGAVLKRRSLGATSEWRLERVRFTPDSIDVAPAGLASSAVTVSLSHGEARRLVTMTRTGIVRERAP